MKTTETSSGSEKIADSLRSFLDAETDATAQVLVEVEAPEPIVAHRRKLVTGEFTLRPYAVEFPKNSAEAERQAVEATRSLLDSMRISYHFSPSARVFAISITPGQLQKLVTEASVRAVIPNRRVKM